MSSSRENSPDWLRCFQVPTHSALTISSGTDSSPSGSPSKENIIDLREPSLYESSKVMEKDKNHDMVSERSGAESPPSKIPKEKFPKQCLKVDRAFSRKRKIASSKKLEVDEVEEKVPEGVTSKRLEEAHALDHSVWALSSDSESSPDYSPLKKQKTSQLKDTGKENDAIHISGQESPSKKRLSKKSLKQGLKGEGYSPKKEKNVNSNLSRNGNNGDVELAEEDTSEKCAERHLQVSTSGLPLVLPEKVHRSKALVECEGESIDLSGDMGAVGRVVIPDSPSGNHEMYLDLKGTIYKTTIVPSRTFCIVSFGQSEAKVEAILNDFIQLKPQATEYEAETMIEGTLDGFSFDSEDEADKMLKVTSYQIDQTEGVDEQPNKSAKRKAEKSSGLQKRGKTARGKTQPPKKVKKKAQVSKKARTKK